MPAAKMIEILTTGSGIEDLTSRIDFEHCSSNAVANGGFGDIYYGRLLGMTRWSSGEVIAIKSIRQYADDSVETQRMLKAAARELHTWSRLKHDNVLTLLGLASFRDRIAMISPWISGGNLLVYIRNNPDADRCTLAYQAANAVAYIHELKPKIAHGDIKSGNFLVSDTGIVKLNDFGTSLVADATKRFTAEGTKSALAMSTRWTSPELLNEESDVYTHEADVYALGMTILEIFTGKIPFAEKQRDGPIIKLVTEGGRPSRPTEIPPCRDGDLLWDLLSSCWSSIPESRPKANRVKEEIRRISQEGLALSSSAGLE